EHFALRSTGIGENAQPVCASSGACTRWPAYPVHDRGALSPGAARGETRFEVEDAAEAAGSLGGLDPRRPGVCAAEPRGDGSVVYFVGGALRARQCVPDQQSAILEM